MNLPNLTAVARAATQETSIVLTSTHAPFWTDFWDWISRGPKVPPGSVTITVCAAPRPVDRAEHDREVSSLLAELEELRAAGQSLLSFVENMRNCQDQHDVALLILKAMSPLASMRAALKNSTEPKS